MVMLGMVREAVAVRARDGIEARAQILASAERVLGWQLGRTKQGDTRADGRRAVVPGPAGVARAAPAAARAHAGAVLAAPQRAVGQVTLGTTPSFLARALARADAAAVAATAIRREARGLLALRASPAVLAEADRRKVLGSSDGEHPAVRMGQRSGAVATA